MVLGRFAQGTTGGGKPNGVTRITRTDMATLRRSLQSAADAFSLLELCVVVAIIAATSALLLFAADSKWPIERRAAAWEPTPADLETPRAELLAPRARSRSLVPPRHGRRERRDLIGRRGRPSKSPITLGAAATAGIFSVPQREITRRLC